MACIIYYKNLNYEDLPTAKRRKTSNGTTSSTFTHNTATTTTTNSSSFANYNPTSRPSETTTSSSSFTSASSFAYANRTTNTGVLSSSAANSALGSHSNGSSQTGSYPSNGSFSNGSYSNSNSNSNSSCNSSYKSTPTSNYEVQPRVLREIPSKLLHDTLKQYFKFSTFRENQLEAVNATCLGLDTLILMPTGGGKSICYQLPAILSDGVTVVVSPLKSLISDQVNRMQGLDVKTSALMGETKENEADSIYHDLRQEWPAHKLLYVTPEKINASNYLMSIFEQLYKRNLLARFVIDEAHCVSTWGADFRPDYRKLGKLRNLFPNVPIMALTATAPPKVRHDILDQLGMDKSKSRVFIQSFNRPNLKFEVRDKSKGCLGEICKSIRANFRKQCGIIYCLSRNDCVQVSAKLREDGISSAPYHAGLSDESRQKIFAAWSRGTFQVVCATIAFGMGIDKADVRFVIHYSMPKSIEGYYQEAGRAGRDGKTAHCILYFSRADLYRMKSMLSKGFGRKAEDKNRDVGNLQHMIDYVDNKSECRRTILLRYLGEEFNSDECIQRVDTVCDNCFNRVPRLG